jgi:hypothetical protein
VNVNDKAKEEALRMIRGWLKKETNPLLKVILQNAVLYGYAVPIAVWYKLLKQHVVVITPVNLEGMIGVSADFNMNVISDMLALGLVAWRKAAVAVLDVKAPVYVAERPVYQDGEEVILLGAPWIDEHRKALQAASATLEFIPGNKIGEGTLADSGITEGIDDYLAAFQLANSTIGVDMAEPGGGQTSISMWQEGELLYSGPMPEHLQGKNVMQLSSTQLREAAEYMMNQPKSWHVMAREFNSKVRLLPRKPIYLNEYERERQYVMMLEELEEFVGAKTAVEQIDALLDLIYVALGAVCEMGINPDPLFRIIHEANMNKVQDKPLQDKNGKVQKPEGWQDPTQALQEEILRQCERGG